ncbi:MAG: YdgA family protein [Opitutaceae bacterium]|nr:YdgA family protein [Opitutaceae bacterium]
MNARIRKYLLVGVAGVIALLVLAILASPFWFGREAEKTYGAMLERLSGSGGLQLVGKNYQRGWLSSTAVTAIRHPQIPFELIARHQIDHGPFPLNRILKGEWRFTPVQAQITSQIFLAAPGTENALAMPPLTAEIRFRLNGGGSVHMEYPPVKKTDAPGLTVDWSGINGDMTFDREWKKFRFDIHMPALAMTLPAAPGDLTMSKVSLRSDMQQGAAGYFLGEGALSVGQVEFGKASERVNLQGLEIFTSAQPAGENVNLVIRYQLDALRVAQENFGPGQLALEVRHLDVAALMKFKKELDAISQGKLPESQVSMMVTGKTLALIGVLAKNAPELEITRLSFKTREGEISGKAKFVLDGRRRNVTQSPMQLLTMMSGDLELIIPEPVLKRLLTPVVRKDIEAYRQHGALSADELAKLDSQSLATIVDRVFPQYLTQNEFTRLLTEDKGLYKLILSIRRGELLINGKPWHLPNRVALTP